jgi:hypothetical protein
MGHAVVIALIILGVLMTGVMIYAILTAKDGIEDEEGFHALKKPEQQSEPPSSTHNPPPPRAEMTAFVGRSKGAGFRSSGTRGDPTRRR